jgi:tricorn protease
VENSLDQKGEFSMSDHRGYYSHPTIYKDSIVFVSDDDLWKVSTAGGVAKRLTANVGMASAPRYSPDGSKVAYLGNDRGHLGLYLISADGGAPAHLVHFGISHLIGWKDNNTILFASNFEQPMMKYNEVYEFDLEEKSFTKLNFGEAMHVRYGKGGAMLIGRNNSDSARWKRYKGGTAGVLWTRKTAKEKFQRILKNIKTNIASPRLIDNQIYFISDHEGSANIYRCELDGKSVKRLTHHEDYYVRNLETDGSQLTYQRGAEIYFYDLKTNKETHVQIECPTPAVQTHPRFESAKSFLEYFAVSDNAQELSVVSRGHGFSMPVFAGPVTEWDLVKDTRYRLPTYSADSKFLYFAGSNSQREDRLLRCNLEKREIEVLFEKQDWGVIWTMAHNPKSDLMAITTNRSELYVADLKTKKVSLIVQNKNSPISEMNWSPDGRYLVYTGAASDAARSELSIYDTKTKKSRMLLNSVLSDRNPVFSLDGQYIYFLSVREFYPVYNATHFDLGFPFALKPYVVALTKTAPNPFKASVANITVDGPKKDEGAKKKKPVKAEPIEVDFDGIDHRVMAFPLNFKDYASLKAIPGGVLYLTKNVMPEMDFNSWSSSSNYDLCGFKFDDNKEEFWQANVAGFDTVHQGQYIVLASNNNLRFVPTTSKPNSESGVGKKSGWIDLDRIRLEIHPRDEWKQMYRETWALQKEHFWRADMSKVEWAKTFQKYLPLLERVKTRGELSDLIWEMQGDLGTSHSYEMGGQYFRSPKVNILGLLGAKVDFVKKTNSYKITRIYRGDSWRAGHDSPLLAASVGLREGDEIVKLNGHGFQQAMDIYSRLQHQNNIEILLTIRRQGKKDLENLTVKTLSQQKDVLYRDWVESNRDYVHRMSKGKLGYVHIPNMAVWGYSEFYRYLLSEIAFDGLIVDVRFNGGGHISQHVLKILAQKPLAITQSRHQGRFYYPAYAVRGPIVGITNESAGSDGDIFSHSFKMMKLGKLIGKRTWGGVIGINAQYALRDRTMVTQPEYSYWFNDVGWDVENYGTDPDIEVDITPEDHQAGRDPQLMRAIEEGLKDLKKKPAFAPEIEVFPNLAQPRLGKKPPAPKRG